MLDTEVALGVKSRIKMDKSPAFMEFLVEQFTGTFYSLPPPITFNPPPPGRIILILLIILSKPLSPLYPGRDRDVSGSRPRYFYGLTPLSIYREEFSQNTKQLSTSTPR